MQSPSFKINTRTKAYRFTVLFFNCLLTFGVYYSFDMPSSIQTELQDEPTNYTEVASPNSSLPRPCPDCLGLGPFKYNLIYCIFAWSFASCVLLAGLFLDKVGNRVGAMLFSAMVLSGSAVFALGVTPVLVPFRHARYPLLLGRILLGAGTSGIRIVQDRVTSFWFRDKELALAFGITMVFSRLGSVVNFLVTQQVVAVFGLEVMVWGAAGLCGMGFLAAVVLAHLENYALRQRRLDQQLKSQRTRVSIRNVVTFPANFWILTIVTVLFYSSLNPSIADSSKYFQDRWGVSRRDASLLEGLLFDVAMVGSPLFGALVDRWGRRAHVLLGSCFLLMVTNALTAFTPLPAAAMSCTLGFAYALGSISIWPSVPLLVRAETLGTAMGVLSAVRSTGAGLTYLAVGKLLDSASSGNRLPQWQLVYVLIAVSAFVALLFAIILIRNDSGEGSVLFHTSNSDLEDSAETDPLLPNPPRPHADQDNLHDHLSLPSSPLSTSTPTPSAAVTVPSFSYPPPSSCNLPIRNRDISPRLSFSYTGTFT